MLCVCTRPVGAQTDPSFFDSVLVADITIVGNKSFDDDELLSGLSTTESPSGFSRWLYRNLGSRFPLAQEPRYFDFQSFRDDLDLLRLFYRNNGFFSSQVEGSYARIDGERAVEVRFEITEGAASSIDSISYRHLQDLPENIHAQVRNNPRLRTGRRYSAADVQAERNRVLEILANNGFPRAYSDSVVVERKFSNNNVVVKIGFHHGRRLYFGPITEQIKGVDNLNLARQIIYDRLDFEQGEVYSRDRQYEGETNLNRLGVFSYVAITPEFPPIDNRQDSLVPITLELIPRKRFELAPAAILNNQLRGLSSGAELAFLMRNVFGGAQSLTTRVNVLGRVSDFFDTYIATSQLRFDQPYLFSNRNSAYLSGSYSLVGEGDLATGNILQLVIGAQRSFSQRLVGQASWTYEISEFSGNPNFLRGRGLLTLDTTINFRNSIRGMSLERDLTDDFFNPTKGISLKGIFEEAGFLENIGISPLPQTNEEKGIRSTEYVKLEGLTRIFHDLSNNGTTILGMKFRLGSIFRYGRSREDTLPVPPNRRYYAGGASSIRGWTARALAADSNAVNFGSNALLEISTEVRWHLFPDAKNWLDGFWFVAFADAGNLWNELRDITPEDIALAFGIGLRYNLFFGPIRVDFGLKGYDPSSEHHKWFFEKQLWGEVVRKGVVLLGIGHAF
ncbi:MAG: BamA/TamA family outer membrane protein [Bacteroidetes bacterium]|nr:BamA/TamA family outer membrane protein [Bacteroidota bacterium]